MIVDFHTHIFPPDLREDRARLVAADSTFGELYGSAKAQLATGEELLESMAEAEVDASVALGFAWRDRGLCSHHNDYLLDVAAASAGRIIPFCTLPLAEGPDAILAEAERCLKRGGLGFGELRPDSVGANLEDASMAEALAAAGEGTTMLFHVTEPVGHAYPGKAGFAIDAFYRFVLMHPELTIVGAHWGGGLPFYTLMPEVKLALAHTCFDTAGTSLLYAPEAYARGIEAVGAEHVLFGSDFPLLKQERSRRRIEDVGLSSDDRDLILGGNAKRLLHLG